MHTKSNQLPNAQQLRRPQQGFGRLPRLVRGRAAKVC